MSLSSPMTLRLLLLAFLFVLVMVTVLNRGSADWIQRFNGISAQEESCVVPQLASWAQFFDYVEETHQPCNETRMLGRNDGTKGVCMDPPYAPRSGGACVVLSFGINNEWSFDDEMEALGCAVHGFDPTMGAVDYQRGEKIHFHNVGLSDRETSVNIIGERVPVKSYRGILEHIGLLNTTIDYLKMDIEGYELNFFSNVLAQDRHLLRYVKQIGMEMHIGEIQWTYPFNPKLPYNIDQRNIFWNYFHLLECLNFRPVSSRENPSSRFHIGKRPVSQLYEILWVNENPY